ncbi:MAG: hypothetical protein V2I43_29125 [Parvularcula sp.]|jgi:uncharacterized membrane protein|nr:hypothetical protein [Parvularcula sp.]
MTSRVASAIFNTRAQAERAIADLRNAGVGDDAISIVANRDHLDKSDRIGGQHVETTNTESAAKDVVGKTAAGAGIGALLGVGALAIPGVGPLVAAGAIAELAVGGAAVTGTAVGAAAGGLAGILTDHGIEDDHVAYYEDHINKGGIFVSVNGEDNNADARRAQEILYAAGGHTPDRADEATDHTQAATTRPAVT